MKDAISPKFEVVDESGKVVAKGVAGGMPAQVQQGVYRVRILSVPEAVVDGVEVKPDKMTLVSGK